MQPPEPPHDASVNEATRPWQDASRLLSVLDDAGLGVWCRDLQRGVMHGSLGTGRLFGLAEPLAEITQSFYLSLIAAEDRPLIEAVVRSALKDGKSRLRFCHRVRRPDSSKRWLEGQQQNSGTKPVRLLSSSMCWNKAA